MEPTGSTGPLGGLTVVERFGDASSDLGRAAVSFAGLLAARFGARVLRGLDADADPMRLWPPFAADGTSAVFRFLTASKTFVGSDAVPAGSCLLTDDEALAAAWPDERKVLVRPAFGIDGTRAQSELTIMAAGGLLDAVGEVGREPLPLPGFQVSYAAGLAAFLGLLASHLSFIRQGEAQPAEVSALDVAAWTNWKQMLPTVSGGREAGIGRSEEWFIAPCRDGFIAPIFLDPNVPGIAELTRSERLLSPDFKTQKARKEHLDEFKQILRTALASRTKADILGEAESLSLPFSAVLEPADVLKDEQMVFRGFVPETRPSQGPRAPVLWNGRPLGGEQP